MKDSVVFCDFDGTITVDDSLGSLLNMYATDNWHIIERSWRNGEIGSKECLTRQMQCIKSISEEEFNNFIESIRIDNTFKKFTEYLKSINIDLYIVSDGFSLIINKILIKNKIFGANIISNDLKFKNNKLLPKFPNENKECKVKNGNCKCKAIEKFGENKKTIYIGDGFSDACAVQNGVSIVFAKNELAKYCDSKNIKYIKYENFDEISNALGEREEYANC